MRVASLRLGSDTLLPYSYVRLYIHSDTLPLYSCVRQSTMMHCHHYVDSMSLRTASKRCNFTVCHHKLHKLSERKVWRLNGFHLTLEKVFPILALSVLKALKKAIALLNI